VSDRDKPTPISSSSLSLGAAGRELAAYERGVNDAVRAFRLALEADHRNHPAVVNVLVGRFRDWIERVCR